VIRQVVIIEEISTFKKSSPVKGRKGERGANDP